MHVFLRVAVSKCSLPYVSTVLDGLKVPVEKPGPRGLEPRIRFRQLRLLKLALLADRHKIIADIKTDPQSEVDRSSRKQCRRSICEQIGRVKWIPHVRIRPRSDEFLRLIFRERDCELSFRDGPACPCPEKVRRSLQDGDGSHLSEAGSAACYSFEDAVNVGAVSSDKQGSEWDCGEDRDTRGRFGLPEVGCGSDQLDGRVDADESLDSRERLDGIHVRYFSHCTRAVPYLNVLTGLLMQGG